MTDKLRKALSILRFKQMLAILNISKTNAYDRLNPKSPRYDPSFPKPVKLGPRSVGFIESEVQDWLQSRASARYG
jgi:prophage regulatory protein